MGVQTDAGAGADDVVVWGILVRVLCSSSVSSGSGDFSVWRVEDGL